MGSKDHSYTVTTKNINSDTVTHVKTRTRTCQLQTLLDVLTFARSPYPVWLPSDLQARTQSAKLVSALFTPLRQW